MANTARQSTRKPGERRGRKKGAPRPSSDQILEAAERIFTEQGYADTSLRQLIAAAGVSTSAFYARFPSKDAVLAAIAERFLAELAEKGASQLSAARSLESGFEVGVAVLVESVRDRRALVGLLLGEAAGSAEVRRGLALALEQLATLLGANLTRLVERGVIEPADAEAAGWAFVGALKIQLERWAVYESLETDALEDALRATADAMLPMLRRRSR